MKSLINKSLQAKGGKWLSNKLSHDFFSYINEFSWFITGFIDFESHGGAVDYTSRYDFDIFDIFERCGISKFPYFCFAYDDEEEVVILRQEDACEIFADLLTGSGDAFVFGASINESGEITFSFKTFFQVRGGDRIGYLNNW